MDLLITDITRMQDEHVCVAGIEAGTRKRVRPVINGKLPASLLASNSGPVDFRRVLRFKEARPLGGKPEVEDVFVDFGNVEVLGSVSPRRVLEVLSSHAQEDVRGIGPALFQRSHNLLTPEGRGDYSLVIVRAPPEVDFFFNDRGSLRFRWTEDVDLSFTDVRPYRVDLRTPMPGAVD